MWLAHQPIAGAVEAVARLDDAGHDVLFVTNFSTLPRRESERRLERIGIDARDRVITSAMAAASLVRPGERVLVCGGPGVVEAVEEQGAEVVHAGPVDAVVVGYHRDFDYDGMSRAARALHDGARLIATNSDPTYPTADGLLPGNGALVAAVATAGMTEPTVAGKPHAPVAELIRSRLGSGRALDSEGSIAVGDVPGSEGSIVVGDVPGPEGSIVVGDVPATDGLLARRLGCRFALVLSGVTSADQVASVDPTPDVVARDLADLVDRLLG